MNILYIQNVQQIHHFLLGFVSEFMHKHRSDVTVAWSIRISIRPNTLLENLVSSESGPAGDPGSMHSIFTGIGIFGPLASQHAVVPLHETAGGTQRRLKPTYDP